MRVGGHSHHALGLYRVPRASRSSSCVPWVVRGHLGAGVVGQLSAGLLHQRGDAHDLLLCLVVARPDPVDDGERDVEPAEHTDVGQQLAGQRVLCRFRHSFSKK